MLPPRVPVLKKNFGSDRVKFKFSILGGGVPLYFHVKYLIVLITPYKIPYNSPPPPILQVARFFELLPHLESSDSEAQPDVVFTTTDIAASNNLKAKVIPTGVNSNADPRAGKDYDASENTTAAALHHSEDSFITTWPLASISMDYDSGEITNCSASSGMTPTPAPAVSI